MSNNPAPTVTAVFAAPEKDLSVVIPAYNEETRLPPALSGMIEYLERREAQSQATGRWVHLPVRH